MQLIVICSLPLEWFVAHIMLWGQWGLIGWEGSWYSLRSSCKVHIIMRHYLGYSFIWLALQKSASPGCWYVKPVAHRLEKMWKITFQQILVLASLKMVSKRTTMQKILLAKICWWQLALKRARLLLWRWIGLSTGAVPNLALDNFIFQTKSTNPKCQVLPHCIIASFGYSSYFWVEIGH